MKNEEEDKTPLKNILRDLRPARIFSFILFCLLFFVFLFL